MSREREDLLAFEEDLSAYLDGELDAEREAELRAELERNPLLASRLAALQAVDVGLQGAPARAVPADLYGRLRARIDASEPASDVAPRAAEGVSARVARGPARRLRWRSAPALAAAAVAAAVALVLLLQRPVENLPEDRIAEHPPLPVPEAPAPLEAVPELELAAPVAPEPVAPKAPVDPLPTPVPEPAPPTVIAEAPAPDPVREPVADVDPAAASDEELEVAMEWELLEDIEMFEELDLLEAMVAMAGRGQG